MDRKTVNLSNINPNIKLMEFAVLGPLEIRTGEIEKELLKGIKKPFNDVIRGNLGDCHRMGQRPITFIRQVLVLCTNPELMKDARFPEDVKKRAQDLLKECSGDSIGSYTDSAGIELIKEHVTEYIKQRDGIPANVSDIILSSGATDGVKSVLSMLNCPVNGKPPGIMVPIPQYPLYSAAIAEYGMHMINYYLDEDNAWALSIKELKRALDEARKECDPRALVVINPGNPTGSVLTRQNMEEIIKFAYDEKLFLMADEVYQDNVYPDNMKFYSFKKIMTELGEPYKYMELASFMSASKGYMGECGLRGGYCELVNVDMGVKKMLLKCVSARSCSTVLGQITMDCVVKPPQKGDPSYDLFIKEKSEVLKSLKERALLVEKTFNKIRGMKCNAVVGAMYAYPRITLPEKAIQKAKSLGQAPDFFYAMQLLENTGICVVPGSGFGQIPGTYHFRTTILPQTDKLKAMLKRIEEYHEKFLDEYK
ncbi:alanine aminotransferase 2 isoform X1 [Parasteatoda tepidariorum]|uniref:alanine aminotransferase 2 isoform X1 n=2 Tax=Parasteatoda tepidariorum TaxID=114398 RepID=UPI001C727AE8|nr:alanine aminotransferase 2-like isoform X1 [Parasteatoda tepidariorum]XP_042906501.1 alanine aminotransferase 2-like isoform X1 [Parasteatoda tepidariorum]XP_042906502.1 alanine aminotransferase 2-like isoform X1 [Parasteatoda tepidariorum]